MKAFFTSLILLFCLSFTIQAQIIDSNAYMKTTYIEVGINQCGAYASNMPPPAYYHTNVPAGLGIVVDGDQDGWDVGTYPYWGDYSEPGAPVEGWGIQLNDTSFYNTDQDCGTNDMPGGFISYDSTADSVRVIWEGNIPGLNILIRQVTIIPANALYFTTRVTIINMSAENYSDVYYLRNIDPDQEEPWTFNFVTNNSVVYNPPLDTQAMSDATGLIAGMYCAYGSRDIRSRASYGNFSTTDANPIELSWSGIDPYYNSGSTTGDIAIQMTFRDSLPAGDSVTFKFAYIFSTNDSIINAAMQSTEKLVVSEPVCAAVPDFTIDNIEYTTASVNWEAADGLNYQVVATPVIPGDVITSESATSPVTLEGLNSCTYYTVQIFTECGADMIASAEQTIYTKCADAIQNTDDAAAFTIYPNPVKDNITLTTSGFENGAANIKITDLSGKLLFEQKITIKTDVQQQIVLPQIEAGMYLISIKQNSIVLNKTIMINQ